MRQPPHEWRTMALSSQFYSVPLEGAGKRFSFAYGAIGPLVALIEFSCVVAVSSAANLYYHAWTFGTLGEPETALAIGVLVGALYCTILAAQGLYTPAILLVRPRQVKPILSAWAIALLVGVTTLYLLKVGKTNSR